MQICNTCTVSVASYRACSTNAINSVAMSLSKFILHVLELDHGGGNGLGTRLPRLETFFFSRARSKPSLAGNV